MPLVLKGETVPVNINHRPVIVMVKFNANLAILFGLHSIGTLDVKRFPNGDGSIPGWWWNWVKIPIVVIE